MPRELLLFLGLDHQYIESYLEDQRVRHPSIAFPANKIVSQASEDVYEVENFKEQVSEGVKKLLIKVVSKQEYF